MIEIKINISTAKLYELKEIRDYLNKVIDKRISRNEKILIEETCFTDTKETMGTNFTAEELKEAARDIEQASKKLDAMENYFRPVPTPSTSQELENIDFNKPAYITLDGLEKLHTPESEFKTDVSHIDWKAPQNEYEVKNIEAPDHFKPLPPITPAPVNNSVDKDIMGFPWDARIHASGKTKNKNGTWKLKRNVDTKLVEQVESDLRKTLNIPLPMPAPAFNPLLTVPTTQPAQQEPVAISYPQLIMKVTSTINSGKMTQNAWLDILKSHNIPDANLLSLRPDLFPVIYNILDGRIA